MELKKYDYLIVGAGLYGAMFAHKANSRGKTCLVIDKNPFVGGFCYTERQYGIDVHKYGAHIFRTNREDVWNFVNSICEFRNFINTPIAKTGNEIYSLPFNLHTFYQVYGVNTPQEAEDLIRELVNDNPANLEEHIISKIGSKMYEKLVKGYTEKQWGKKCSELPISIMSRIPIRMNYDCNYYNEYYQGVPLCGYTEFIKRLLCGSEVHLGVDYFNCPQEFLDQAETIVYTGPIDKFYGYRYGRLDYRSVVFAHVYYPNTDNVQGNAVVNYPDPKVPYTRSIEHKHFVGNPCQGSVVSYEFPTTQEEEPSYPINDELNAETYKQYKLLADQEERVIFGGRLAEYRYYSMNEIVEQFI